MEEVKAIDNSVERRLREACAELDRRIQAGDPCRAEDILAESGNLATNPEFALELIYTEFAARDRRNEQIPIEQWYDRFPQWRDDIARLIELHQLVHDTDGRSRNESTLTHKNRSHWMAGERSLLGERIGQYELLAEIGHGGMGVVYKARQLTLDRIVAIKMLTFQATPLKRARFRKEAEAIARLHHPNIVQIHEVGEQGGCAYLSMEFVDGLSLGQQLAQAPLAARSAAQLLETLARAMHYAHGLGIVHRDLKPANVLLTRSGEPKITDFGLVKLLIPSRERETSESALGTERDEELTTTGQILGTPSYMAPEQATARSELIGPATDVYALGAVLYETLCGRAPFRGETPLDTLDQVRSQEPLRPSRLQPKLPSDLETICLKCLSKETQKRYATAEQLADDLRRFLAGRPIAARPVGALERAWRWSQRNPWIAGLVAAVLLVSTLGTLVAALFALDAREQKHLANQKAWDAQAKQAEATEARAAAEVQQARAEHAEALAKERLANVTLEKQRADEKAQIAKAVNEFLQQDLLQQADSAVQFSHGYVADPNLTVRKALDRAANRIGERFHDQPLVEAAIRQTIGMAYRGIGNPQVGVPHLELAHQLLVTQLGTDHRDTLQCAIELAYSYKATGKFDQAIPLLEHALDELQEHAGPEHRNTLVAMGNLALVYAEAGKPNQTVPLFEKVQRKLLESLGPDNPLTLLSMNHLAWAYQGNGQLARALPLFEQTLAKQQETLSADHPDTLQTMNNLGVAYIAAAKIDKALPLLKQVLAKRREALTPDHPLTALSTYNLGKAYFDASQYAEAQPLLEQALEKQKQVLYPDHPHTLANMKYLGVLYWYMNKLDRSIPLLEQSLVEHKRILGEQHPETLESMTNLGGAYRDAGRLPDSLQLLKQALAIQQELLSPDHPITVQTMFSLGKTYKANRQLDEALPLMEQALEKQKQVLHSEHPNTLVAMNDLAQVYWSMQRLDRSIPLFEQTVEILKKTAGDQNMKTLFVAANLGVNYRDADRLDDAIPLLEQGHKSSRKFPELAWTGKELLEVYARAGKTDSAVALAPELIERTRHKHAAGSAALATELTNYGWILLRAGAFAEAQPIIEECLAIRQKSQPDDWTLFNLQSMLGGALLGQKKYDEAEPLLLQGYEGMKQRSARIPVKVKVRLTDALERLVQLYEAWEKDEEAARWRMALDAGP